jgi:hypothetical protein
MSRSVQHLDKCLAALVQVGASPHGSQQFQAVRGHLAAAVKGVLADATIEPRVLAEPSRKRGVDLALLDLTYDLPPRPGRDEPLEALLADLETLSTKMRRAAA